MARSWAASVFAAFLPTSSKRQDNRLDSRIWTRRGLWLSSYSEWPRGQWVHICRWTGGTHYINDQLPHVVYAFVWLEESENSIFSSLRHVDDALVVAECKTCRRAQTSQSNRSNALLLHVNYKQAAFVVRWYSFSKRPTVCEKYVSCGVRYN